MRLDLRFERTARGHLFLAGKSICVGGQLNFIARSSFEIGVDVLRGFRRFYEVLGGFRILEWNLDERTTTTRRPL